MFIIYIEKKETMSNQPINNRKDYERNYSNELRKFLSAAEKIAEDIPVSEITPEYFVLHGLGNENSMMYKTLNTFLDSVRIKSLYDEIYELVDKSLNVTRYGRKINLSSRLINIIKKTIKERGEENLINSSDVLLYILEEDTKIAKVFDRYNITQSLLFSLIKDLKSIISEIEESSSDNSQPQIITMTLNSFDDDLGPQLNDITKQLESIFSGGTPKKESSKKMDKNHIDYCTSLNQMANVGKIDNIVGRDKEIDDIIEILNRRKSNNVIIVGETGVGKTALVEGLALKINNNEVPSVMSGKKIWKLNIPSMIAGTQFRGMFEERMTNLINRLKSDKNNILFIDDIQSIASNNRNSDYDIMGALNDVLIDGDVQVIATTSFKGYRTMFETNNTFSSKFQKVTVEKLSKNDCFAVLKYLKPHYEKHHNVTYSDDVLKLCVDLSERYITEKSLPTSAIDIMDELGSHCFLRDSFSITSKELMEIKNELKRKIDKAIKKDKFEEAEEFNKELEEIDKKIAHNNNGVYTMINERIKISSSDIYEVVSKRTGIPIGKLTVSEKGALRNIETVLKKNVIGQDEAIAAVSKAIKRNKLGISKKDKPSSFMFIGKSGCGKTLLAKKIAEEVYGDEKYLVRFDMSEYSDKTSTNKLIGSSAGYVGYDEGGLLTEAIKKKKYAVLLIDEIEKANSEVFNLFLQVLDEGYLTDNTGKKVDFKNTIIILTSNIGTKRASLEKGIGFEVNDDDKFRLVVEKEIKNKFPPEFINRIDELVYFNTLTDDSIRGIIRLELNKLKNKLKEANYNIEFNEDVVEFIFNTVSNERDYGARPIIRAIQNEIENKIIDILIEREDKNSFEVLIEKKAVKVV